MDALINALKRHAAGMDASTAHHRMATVESFDPVNHAVKVTIQPEGVLSGWIPLGAVSVGANAVVAPPNIGDQVIVAPQEGAGEELVVVGRVFDTQGMPPSSPATGKPVQSGEVAVFGPSGSYLHLAGGNIYGQAGTIALTGTLAVTGKITATDTISSKVDVIAGAANISLVNHKTTAVQPGGGLSGPPE